MTEIQKLKEENKKLLNALKDANSLMTENIESYKLDTPKYWNITKILESKGYKVNGIMNYFR
tara:strand:+ start:60 stop:245 length:186 start_codon:yes stop_codon:yes gene_type:complete